MEKQFVPYELAVKLKELGFDEDVFEWFDTETKDFCDVMKEVKAPLYQQAFRWFGEKYGLFCFEDHRCNSSRNINSKTYWIGIKSFKLKIGVEVVVGSLSMGCFKTYEEAELACLQKLIEIVEQTKN